MILNMYSIYDIKAELYNAPFSMARDALAARAFADLVSDSRTTIGAHPDDYKLVYVGQFDDETGSVALGEKRTLGFGRDFMPSGLREVRNGEGS